MSDAKRIEKDLLAELKAHGVTMTDLKRRQVRDVAGDMALVERLRDQINQGAALDLDSFMKLKASATASKAELFDGLAPHTVSKIEVELVPAPAQYRKLEDENAALKLQLAAQPRSEPSEPAGALGLAPAAQPASSPDSPAAPSAASNVVPLNRPTADEERRQRILENRKLAGDVLETGWQRTSFSDSFPREGMPGFGMGRFDFPSGRGGW